MTKRIHTLYLIALDVLLKKSVAPSPLTPFIFFFYKLAHPIYMMYTSNLDIFVMI